MKRTRLPRRGFSLIELTVVVAIIGILMTISAGAFVRYFWNARQRSTEAVMQILDNEVGQRVESFWKKVNPPTRLRHTSMAGLGIIDPSTGTVLVAPTNEQQAVRLRRAMLLAKLEAMRGDFPQQFADFLPGPSGGLATCTNTAAPLTDNAAAVASRARAAIEAEYRRLTYEKSPTVVPNNAARGQTGYNQVTQIAPHSHQTESAACLYLMLKVGSGEGRSFDMASIPPAHIRDTDGDGVPEIVDAWGTPLRFYRWPTDLIHSLVNNSNRMGGAKNILDPIGGGLFNSNNQNSLDPERLLYTNEWIASTYSQTFERNTVAGTAGAGNYFRVAEDPPPPTGRKGFSYPLYPMIISAGPDAVDLAPEDKWQAFGLVWGDTAGSQPTGTITTSWPPYSDIYTRAGKIAEETPFSTSYLGAGAHADNIYSRVIRAGQEAN